MRIAISLIAAVSLVKHGFGRAESAVEHGYHVRYAYLFLAAEQALYGIVAVHAAALAPVKQMPWERKWLV